MARNTLTPIFGEGCCATCGFLAQAVATQRDRLAGAQYGAYGAMLQLMRMENPSDTHVLDVENREASLAMRQRGSFTASSVDMPNPTMVFAVPSCFVSAADPILGDEAVFMPGREDSPDPKSVLKVIQRSDRACKEWFEWRPGLHPAEHVRMRDVIELERDRRKWESDMEEERRAFNERLDERNKEFLAGLDSERREWEKGAGRWPNRLIVAAVILAVGQVMAGVLALPLITRLLHLD